MRVSLIIKHSLLLLLTLVFLTTAKAALNTSNITLDVSTQESQASSLFMSPQGNKLFILGNQNQTVFQYHLSTPFDLLTASYTGISVDVSRSGGNSVHAMTMNNTGTRLYVLGATDDNIVQYELSTAFDLSSAAYSNRLFYVGDSSDNAESIRFNNSGSKLFISDSSSAMVYQYSLSSPFQIDTMSYDNINIDVNTQDSIPRGIDFNANGTKMYLVDANVQKVLQYDLSTGFDLSTAIYQDSSHALTGKMELALLFANHGAKFYALTSNSIITQYEVFNPYNTLVGQKHIVDSNNSWLSAYQAAKDGDVIAVDDGSYLIDNFELDKQVIIQAKNTGKVVFKSSAVSNTIFIARTDSQIKGIKFDNAKSALSLKGNANTQVTIEDSIISNMALSAINQDDITDGYVSVKRTIFKNMPLVANIDGKGRVDISNALFYDVTRLANVTNTISNDYSLVVNHYVTHRTNDECNDASKCSINHKLTDTKDLNLLFLLLNSDTVVKHNHHIVDFGNVHVNHDITKILSLVPGDKFSDVQFSDNVFSSNDGVEINAGNITFSTNKAGLAIQYSSTNIGTQEARATLSKSGEDDYVFFVKGNSTNDKPVANDDNFTIDEDSNTQTFNVLANDTDANADTLSITNVFINPNHGVVSINAGHILYTPKTNFNGIAVINYTISDGYDNDSANLTITVNPIADAPIAVNDTVTLINDQPIVIDVLANDSDADNDRLSIVSAKITNGGTIRIINGVIIFTPEANFTGNASITYTISDGNTTATAVVSITADYYINTITNNTITNNSTLSFIKGRRDLYQQIQVDIALFSTDTIAIRDILPDSVEGLVGVILNVLPLSVVSGTYIAVSETTDGVSDYSLSGSVTMNLPFGDTSTQIGGGDILVYNSVDSDDSDNNINALFVKFSLLSLLVQNFGDKIPQTVLDLIPNVPVFIGYSHSALDQTQLSGLPQPVQNFFGGILSPEFGIPVFNGDGSFNVFIALGFDALPAVVKKGLEDLGITKEFVDNARSLGGLQGQLVQTLAVGNINGVISILGLLFPELAVENNGGLQLPNIEAGVIFPSSSVPPWLDMVVGAPLKALGWEPNPSIQLRMYGMVNPDVFTGEVGIVIGTQGSLRINPPRIINPNAMNEEAGTEPLDIRMDIEVALAAEINPEANVGLTARLQLVNDWIEPFGIPNLSFGESIIAITVQGSLRGVDLSAGVDAGFEVGAQAYCLDDEGEAIAGGAANIGIEGRLGVGATIIAFPIDSIAIDINTPAMSLQNMIRCSVNIPLSVVLGLGETLFNNAVKIPDANIRNAMRQLHREFANSSSDIKSIVNTIIEKPLEFKPLAIFLNQIRMSESALAFSTDGDANLDRSAGLLIKGGAEYRVTSDSEWQNIGNVEFSADLSGGLKAVFALGDYDLGGAGLVKMDNVMGGIELTLLPPTAKFQLSGNQTFFDFMSNTDVLLSSNEGIHVNSTTTIANLGQMYINSRSTGSLLGYPEFLDLSGKIGFNLDLNNVSNQIFGAFNNINSGLDNEYRRALDTLQNQDNTSRRLRDSINNISYQIHRETGNIGNSLRPALNWLEYLLNNVYNNRNYQYQENRRYIRLAQTQYCAWYAWWCHARVGYYWTRSGAHWAIYLAQSALLPSAISLVNNARNNLNQALNTVVNALSPRLNALRLSLVVINTAKRIAYIIVRGLQEANNLLNQVATAIRDIANIRIYQASAFMNSYTGFITGQSPISIDLDAELTSLGIRCTKTFDLFLYDPVRSFNNIIKASFNACITDRKNTEQVNASTIARVNYHDNSVDILLSQLTTGVTPTNDSSDNAINLGRVSSASVTGSNLYATTTLEANESEEVLQTAAVWYQWQPAYSDIYEISADGHDTAINIYLATDASPTTVGTLLIRDIRPARSGKITYEFDANQVYFISIASQVDDPGQFTLKIKEINAQSAVRHDDFANARVLLGNSGSLLSNNIGATITQAEVSINASLTLGNTLWYRYRANEDGVYDFNTEDSEFDTVIRAYRPASLTSATSTNLTAEEIASLTIADLALIKTADDIGLDPVSSLQLRLRAGQRVWLSIASKYGALGALNLSWRYTNLPVANWVGDNFADAVSFTLGNKKLMVSSLGATTEVNEPLHAGISNFASVWAIFTPTKTSEYIIDTQGSDINTVMAIYIGTTTIGVSTTIANLTEMASNDNGAHETSRIEASLTMGTTYYIAVAGKDEFEGNIVLNYQLGNSNDSFLTPSTLTSNSGEFFAALTGASTQTNEPNYELILARDEATSTMFNFMAAAASVTGEGAPVVEAASLMVVADDIYNTELNNLRANRLDKSLWWTYTPTQTGVLELLTISEDTDTAIFVFEGSSPTMNATITYNDNHDNKLISRLLLDVSSNTIYTIAITARDSTSTVEDVDRVKVYYELTSFASESVANDKPSNAIAFIVDINNTRRLLSHRHTALNTHARGNNNDYDIGEDRVPKRLTSQADKRLWWLLRSNVQGRFNLNTNGSTVETVLEVYERLPTNSASRTRPLFLVEYNDSHTSSSDNAQLSFITKPNTDYLVSVDSIDGDSGELALNHVFNADIGASLVNDSFADAIVLNDNGVTLTINNYNQRYQAEESRNLDGLLRNHAMWYKWQAPANGSITLTIEANDNIDPVMGVYQGNSLNNLSLVSYHDDTLENNNAQTSIFVIPGAQYNFAVSAKQGIEGTFTLNLSFNAIVVPTELPTNANSASATLFDTNNTKTNSFSLSNIGISSSSTTYASSITRSIYHTTSTLNTGSDLIAGDDLHASSLWYEWTAPSTGSYRFDAITNSEIHPLLEVYQGNNINSIILINSSDIASFTINANASQTFYLRLTSNYEEQGQFVIDINRVGERVNNGTPTLMGEFASVPSVITSAGTFFYNYTAIRDGTISIRVLDPSLMDLSTEGNVRTIETTTITLHNSTGTMVVESPNREQTAFHEFIVQASQTYQVRIESAGAIYGDSFVFVRYLTRQAVIQNDNINNFMNNMKTDLLPMLSNTNSQGVVDRRMVRNQISNYIASLPSVTLDDVEVELKVIEQQGTGTINAVRLLVIDRGERKVLVSSEIDPNNTQDPSSEQHMELTLNNALFEQLAFVATNTMTVTTTVGTTTVATTVIATVTETIDISFPDDAFLVTDVNQAFTSARRKMVSSYSSRTVTPQFQTTLYEISLDLFDSDTTEYETGRNNTVINKVVVRIPISSTSLFNWLGDSSLSYEAASTRLTDLLRQGRLGIMSANNVNNLLTNTSVQSISSSNASINLTGGYVEFETSHFSAFMLIINSITGGSGGGGCVYNPNAEFDIVFILLVLLSIYYLLRRRRVVI